MFLPRTEYRILLGFGHLAWRIKYCVLGFFTISWHFKDQIIIEINGINHRSQPHSNCFAFRWVTHNITPSQSGVGEWDFFSLLLQYMHIFKKEESTHMQTGLLPPCWRQSRMCWWQCTDTLPRDWWHEGYWSAGSPLQGCSLDLSPCLCLFHLPSTCTDRLMKTEALAPSMKSDAGQEHVAFLLFQKASHKETND